MPTTSDYLTQLEQDREDLVDNLETQGITGLTGDETFTELVPEVLNISGGGETPTTLDPVNDLLDDYVNYLDSIPNSYSALTDTPTTLYTPNINYNKYYIAKNSTGYYRIYWVRDNLWRQYSNSGYPLTFYYNYDSKILVLSTVNSKYRTKSTYSNLQDAINAIKSNSTEYETENSFAIGFYGSTYLVDCSNGTIVDNSGNTFNSQKVSSNETIEVIQ